jgi:Fe-Mn family superoxide dismutase
MAIKLPKLPYPLDALEPYISRTTLEIHHGRHHSAYVEKTNLLIADTELANRSLEEIISMAAPRKRRAALFNNAAQAWNHAFYWNSMFPGGGKPRGALADRIGRAFKSFAAFCEAFTSAAERRFGSGWAWLTFDGQRLEFVTTSNREIG